MRESPPLSPFEALPRELNWKIFDYVPESIFEIRLASRLLRERVDEYALHPVTITLVERASIVKRNSEIELFLNVPIQFSPIFELRLLLRNTSYDLKKLVKRTSFGQSLLIPHHYRINANPHDGTLDSVRDCMGKRVAGVNLSNCDNELSKLYISKLLYGVKFVNLDVNFYSLSDESAHEIFSVIKTHGVERLILTVRNVIISSSVRIMLQFSELVQSLLIRHPELPGNNNHYFFGAENIDWSPAIVQMFQRKLEHLIIETDYVGYLSKKSADHIRERLPLFDKRIWFETTCNAFENNFDDSVNEYWVSYDADDFVLKIRHSSNMLKMF